MIIGITGYARTGKDTLANGIKMVLKHNNIACKRLSFAWALKNDLDDFLLKKIGISAFTENLKEKELIRPLLVTYGTDIIRKITPNYWIERVNEEIVAKHKNKIILVPDVRFENEALWIKESGGKIINVERFIDGKLVEPANSYEENNSVAVLKYVDSNLIWDNNDLMNINDIVSNILTELFGSDYLQSLKKKYEIY